jgi:UDP-N-acetylglucosamine--N-acetylmuramyl-(pentapeptide) pyrophosphoryl-undecaprenol N-acetylglucosamine transferase
VVPNPLLTGGHQIKNAQQWEDVGAAVVLAEDNLISQPDSFRASIQELLANPDRRTQLSAKIRSFAIPDAAQKLAQVIRDVAEKK